MDRRSSARNAESRSEPNVSSPSSESRRALSAFELTDARGSTVQSGNAEAVIGNDALSVGPVTVSFLDADQVSAADYRIRLGLWPGGSLTLSGLGRRFDTFSDALRTVRNQARVAGLLAHGIVLPEIFSGVVVSAAGPVAAEFHLYDTHLTIVPDVDDPWQVPLGSITAVRSKTDPPRIVIDTGRDLTTIGQLGRRLDACRDAIMERWKTQRTTLAAVTGDSAFADGCGVSRDTLGPFDELVDRLTAPERASCRDTLLGVATAAPRLGIVQLLDPDADALTSPHALPANHAAFLLAPIGSVTVLELLAGPAAATYVFRGDVDAVNRDLQLLHFRRAPLALTESQAALTPDNPYRLALRRLQPLQRLRSITVARLVHNDDWAHAFHRMLETLRHRDT